ncbi:hypothetical protein ACVBEJ_01225 [Porticoccus sp. GXU_MW_L64]
MDICGEHFIKPKHGSLLACLFVFSLPLQAEIQWQGNGFGSVVASKLDDNSINQMNTFSRDTSDDSVKLSPNTRLGYQLSAHFNKRFSMTAQAITQGNRDFDINLDWLYASYKVDENLQLNIGRFRRPTYTYSEYLHVGYSYPWIRPPVEVYSLDLEFFTRVEGVSLFYQRPVGSWLASVQTYYGRSSDTAKLAFNENVDFRTRNDRGVLFTVEKDAFNARLGYHKLPDTTIGLQSSGVVLLQSLRSVGFSNIADDLEIRNRNINFYNFSVGVDVENYFVNAEFTQTEIGRSLGPDEKSWYVTAGHRINAFTLHYTYADRGRDNEYLFSQPIRLLANNIPPAAAAPLLELATAVDFAVISSDTDQYSHTLGLRYDFDAPYTLKVEGQQINDRRLGLSNYLLSVAVDFVF